MSLCTYLTQVLSLPKQGSGRKLPTFCKGNILLNLHAVPAELGAGQGRGCTAAALVHADAKPDVGVQMVEPKRLTLAQLKEYDGSDRKKPIYLAIRGIVFDVSKGKLHISSNCQPAWYECIPMDRAVRKCSIKAHNSENVGLSKYHELRPYFCI